MRTRRRSVLLIGIVIVLLMLACGPEDITTNPASNSTASTDIPSTARPEYKGELEITSALAQTVSNGALSYSLKAIVPIKISWPEGNLKWQITGADHAAKGVVTLKGSGVTCTGNLTGNVEIQGVVNSVKLQPCIFKLTIFQDWSNTTLSCAASFPFAYTYEIHDGSAAFSINDDFSYQATSGDHSIQVSYTNGALTGFLWIKMRSFNGSLIDGCGVTY